jgi:Na+-driven multidrug efflux pump
MFDSSQERQARIIEGSVPKTLIGLAAPMLVGIMALMGFNLIDTFFVGKLGTRELAAMTLTFPVVMMIGTFTIGLGVGALATVSHALGEDNRRAVRRLTTDSLSLAICCMAVLMVVGLLTQDPVFRLEREGDR